MTAGADGGAGKLIYLNGSSGVGAEPAAAEAAAGGETDAVQSKMDGLTQQERKQLRQARFGGG